jgi:hypothetical protein
MLGRTVSSQKLSLDMLGSSAAALFGLADVCAFD